MLGVVGLVVCYAMVVVILGGMFLADRRLRLRDDQRKVVRDAEDIARYAALTGDDSSET